MGEKHFTYFFILMVHVKLLDHVSRRHGAVVDDDVHVGPELELALPVADRRQRHDHQERTADAVLVDLLHTAARHNRAIQSSQRNTTHNENTLNGLSRGK